MERQLCTQMSVWQKGYNNNVCHVVWMFWLTLGRSFALFLCTFIVDFEYHLFIVGATLMTYLCGKPKRDYIYGSSCKTLVSNSANDKGVLQRYLFISCYDNVIFNFYYLILEKLVQSINEINRIFYIFFISLTLRKFSQCFKVLTFNIETVFLANIVNKSYAFSILWKWS